MNVDESTAVAGVVPFITGMSVDDDPSPVRREEKEFFIQFPFIDAHSS